MRSLRIERIKRLEQKHRRNVTAILVLEEAIERLRKENKGLLDQIKGLLKREGK